MHETRFETGPMVPKTICSLIGPLMIYSVSRRPLSFSLRCYWYGTLFQRSSLVILLLLTSRVYGPTLPLPVLESGRLLRVSFTVSLLGFISSLSTSPYRKVLPLGHTNHCPCPHRRRPSRLPPSPHHPFSDLPIVSSRSRGPWVCVVTPDTGNRTWSFPVYS